MHESRVRLLQSMAIFGGISARTLELIVEDAPVVNRAAGEFFFREGDPGKSMFVLESGRVAALREWRDEPRLLRHLGAGDCFGEMSLIDIQPRSASVQALEPCSAIEIEQTALLELYRSDLEQFTMIQMNMGREVSRRLRLADDRLFAMEQERASS